MDYNYRSFNAGEYDLVNFRGPAPGQKAPDFDVMLADGTKVKLLDFDSRFLVLEMGSITCPLFQGRRNGMARLVETYKDVSFAVLYVREAHPGDRIGAHKTTEEKQQCAARLTNIDHEQRRVLVDDLRGTAHAAYGGYPNSVFIINRNGCVVYASDWNDPAATGKTLKKLLAGQPADVRSYFKPPPPWVSLRILRNGGRGALPDFLRSLPRLIWNNLIRRNMRLLMGRPHGIAPDANC